jgi:hypothetical protein
VPDGHRKSAIASAIADTLEVDFRHRVLPFDLAAGVEYAALVARREKSGRPIGMADAMVAATTLSAGGTGTVMATSNDRDFEHLGLSVVNPWGES